MALVSIGGAMAEIRIDAHVIDTLMRDLTGHDRQTSAFLVYLLLYRLTRADGAGSIALSLREIAEATGLSKRGVQSAISHLHKRRLVGIARAGLTDIPRYSVLTPWQDRQSEPV